MSISFGFGVRALYDSHLNFWRPGLPCALRIRKFVPPAQGYGELGFQYSPSGAIADQQGFDDVPIKPQPEVKEVSLRDIGLNQAKLMFGAKQFIISHTFVLRRMQKMNYSDPYRVFRDRTVVGIAYPVFFGATPDANGNDPNAQTRLFSIESITHDEIAGQTLAYTLLCNATEQLVSVAGS